MLLGTLVPYGAEVSEIEGMGFLEILAPDHPQLNPSPLPNLPLIWQCPVHLPMHHPDEFVRQGVFRSWQTHLEIAGQVGVILMVVQFHRPAHLTDKSVFIQQSIQLLEPLTEQARQKGIQLVLRNSPDNRDQLQLLREIMRGVAGLGLALDIAYAQHQVIKNLTPEYLWDSDLSGRLAHVYACDTNGLDANLRLPLGSLGLPDWAKLVRQLKERYNASVTLDIGSASPSYLALSRALWMQWWED